MKKLSLNILVLFVFALSLVFAACGGGQDGIESSRSESSAASTESASGNQVHDFTLKDFNGNEFTLSSLKGKPVLLDFWASWCPPCKKAMPFLASLDKKYRDQGFVLIGVNLDRNVDIPAFRQLLDKYDVEYKNVVALGSNVPGEYGVTAMPTTVLINPEFEEVMRFVGLNPSAEKQLEEKIKELLAEEV